jgi:hypothetical protein
MSPPRISKDMPQHRRKPNLRLRARHLAFVRLLPCTACGRAAPSEAAHVRCGTDGGTSLKPSDRYAVPLCEGCHKIQHGGELSFWSALRIDPLDIALRLWTVSGDLEAGLRTIARSRQAIGLRRGNGQH